VTIANEVESGAAMLIEPHVKEIDGLAGRLIHDRAGETDCNSGIHAAFPIIFFAEATESCITALVAAGETATLILFS
jgi:hypothetical protein